MPTIITITNQKGGVGKTTTAAALLTALHRRGARVLGVDLDPQGSLGFSLGLDIEPWTPATCCPPISSSPPPSWNSTAPAGSSCSNPPCPRSRTPMISW